jgi:NAD-dependent dihydropyrimidine dehydrogenase PreA subunit
MFNSYQTTTLAYNSNLCNGCSMCVAVCPHGVFEMQDRKAVLLKPAACMECGACQLNCQAGAISVESGTGCATAMMIAALRGRKEVSCG